MFKGLSGLKKAVQGGFSAVAENSSKFAEQVVGDPTTSKEHLKESIKKKVQGGVATVIGAGEAFADAEPSSSREKVGEVAHNIKHYGAFGEDYLGYSDPAKELRKKVKEQEKAAKKARKAKKKKTGKKEDLFDPENLAKYKRELEEKKRRQEEAEKADKNKKEEEEAGSEKENVDGTAEPRLQLDLAVQSDSESEPSAAPTPLRTPLRSPAQTPKETDDWRAFQSLTSGVDSLIKKTQEKETEFQSKNRKEVKVVDKTEKAEKARKKKKQTRWVNLDSDVFEEFDGEIDQAIGSEEQEEEEANETAAASEASRPANLSEPEVAEEKELEEPDNLEDDDDLFNTDFVNAITRGEVKLAVVPDSPSYEDEDDPFNTTFADEVVQKQKQEKRKEESRLKFTGLSAVADVLSGKSQTIDKSAVEVTVRSKRRRANRINLIAEEANEVTALEDIDVDHNDGGKVVNVHSEDIDILGDLDNNFSNGEVLTTTPSPCPVTPALVSDSEKKVDVSEFEVLTSSGGGSHLTSNVAILSGEFAKPVAEEEDEFDAAFDALAHESVTKYKLEELEKEFENDDIFDTSTADKVLKLASLIDKVEDKTEPEIVFEDPFDTSAYDEITADVDTELEFESLANREPDNFLKQPEDSSSSKKKAGEDSSVFGSSFPAPQTSDTGGGWVAFEVKKKPARPAAPPRPAPKRPPPLPHVSVDYTSRPETPSVVVHCASVESIKSWNCAVADNLIRKSEIEAPDTLPEQEEEFDPFDTTDFEDEKGITNFEDPFDTSAVDGVIGIKEEEVVEEIPHKHEEKEEESEIEEEEVPDPFDVITCIQGDENLVAEPIKPEAKEVEETDPFDTSFAADILPNKGDPFNTSFVSEEPGKAEIKALEEEFLSDIPKKQKVAPDFASRVRPKGSVSVGREISIKSLEEPEEEYDPFDTSIVDKVIPVRKGKKDITVSVEDDDFDPATTFQKSKSPALKKEEVDPFDTSFAEAEEQKPLEKVDSIDSDDFDPRA